MYLRTGSEQDHRGDDQRADDQDDQQGDGDPFPVPLRKSTAHQVLSHTHTHTHVHAHTQTHKHTHTQGSRRRETVVEYCTYYVIEQIMTIRPFLVNLHLFRLSALEPAVQPHNYRATWYHMHRPQIHSKRKIKTEKERERDGYVGVTQMENGGLSVFSFYTLPVDRKSVV